MLMMTIAIFSDNNFSESDECVIMDLTHGTINDSKGNTRNVENGLHHIDGNRRNDENSLHDIEGLLGFLFYF